MKYEIIENPEYTSVVKVGISLNPDNEVLRFFLSSLKLEDMPIMLESIINSKGIGSEFSSLIYYEEMDWEDKEGLDIEAGDINIYHQMFGELTIKESIFLPILIDYCYKLVQVYKTDSKIPINWGEEMKNQIELLKNRV